MTSTIIPVLLAPANLTRHLKVFLDDKTQWRGKSKLIVRYSQILHSNLKSDLLLNQEGYDLSLYMAIPLLPDNALDNSLDKHISSNGANSQKVSLWTLLQDPSSPFSSLKWPESLSDPSVQKSVFLTRMDPTAFSIPRHLLVLTPLEKLQQGITDFFSPILQSWAIDDKLSGCNEPMSIELLPQLIAAIPQKWEHYSDFTLLPPTSFLTPPWPIILRRLEEMDRAQEYRNSIMIKWEKLIQEALGSCHIARKAIIPVQDVLRRPQIRPLTGNWKIHNQYKTWVEQDLGFLEHQDVAIGNMNKSTEEGGISKPSSVIAGNEDTTAPTIENFSQAYWAETCQNQVWYKWAPMFTMFSAGNITEKERVAKSRPVFDARGKVVVDLYAGIGYFTLVYLVHAGAKAVHACEWNPWSVEGLLQGAVKNEIAYKVYREKSTHPPNVGSSDLKEGYPSESMVPFPSHGKKPKNHGQLYVYPGDNAQWIGFFENQAHHVNLGLIPSAEPGWVLGVRALCPREGGYLHVHHNVRVGEEEAFKTYLLKSLQELFTTWKAGVSWSISLRHVENVKSFAPMVFHYVYDIECKPNPSLHNSTS
ncbi:tRNA methyltransferase tyw3 [Entomortierella beljakovae]|nr:tRNA methyltransferase tyw3 [Entomortierella beljakovae]